MTGDSPLKIQHWKNTCTMTKEEVADALGRHATSSATVAGRLDQAVGRPQRYCVKHYSRDVLAQQITDISWLDKVWRHSRLAYQEPRKLADSRNQGTKKSDTQK